MNVNLYLAVNSRLARKSEKIYAYILECIIKGETVTIGGTEKTEATYHGAHLEAAAAGLRRIRKACRVTIYTEDAFIVNMLPNLSNWIGSGFVNARGERIKNAEQWEAVADAAADVELHGVKGKHAYSYVMEKEMEKNKWNQHSQQ